MNSKEHLKAWASEWAAYRSTQSPEMPDLEPEKIPAPSGTPGNFYTVDTGLNMADLLFRQLTSTIAPDLGESKQSGAWGSVSATGGTFSQPALESLAPGSIHHLRPELIPDRERPIFVFVERVDQERHRLLLVPFGPFSSPAIESELATGIADESLKVLCLWNAAWVPESVLLKSWVIDQAGGPLLKDVQMMREAMAQKKALPEALQARVGDRLVHSTDDRQDYVEEEEGILDSIACED